MPDLPDQTTLVEQIQSRASGPESLDSICSELGAESQLVNVHLASAIDAPILGRGVYLPVMISESRGGRRSALQLARDDETLMGIHINGSVVGLKYWTRLSGESDIAAAGDTYRERWLTLSGRTLSEGDGEVVDIDNRRGNATIHFRTRQSRLGIGDIKLPPIECDCDATVILWTAICWGDCKCRPSKAVG